MSLKQLFKIKNNKFVEIIKERKYFIAVILVIAVIVCFMQTNNNLYKKPIAKITAVTEKTSQVGASAGGLEQIKKQQLTAYILNGLYKGKTIHMENTASYSQVSDLDLKVNDEVFINISENSKDGSKIYKIIDFKRDTYIVYAAALFIILMLIAGGTKGARSLASLAINCTIFFAVIELYSKKINLSFICIIASILFVFLSILIVCGKNKKALAAIISTMAGTFISVLIAVLVIQLNNWNGVHMEEMEFLTHPPKQIFLMEILIGTLGGIMDIAISISAALFEMYDKNPLLEMKMLIKSGTEIGKDIMGTMSNTLVFAYVSGSIPMVLLILRNNYPISYIININLSLEIIRALAGSIGIVLSIPISVFISAVFIKNYRIGEIKL